MSWSTTPLLVAFASLVTGSPSARAQPSSPTDPASATGDRDAVEHYRRKSEAMTVLVGWGSANVLGGAAGALAAEDRRWRQFYLMNAGWGAVNAALGAFGLRSARADGRGAPSNAEGLQDLSRTERILLFNAGLDVGYVMGGLYLTERARRSAGGDRDRGWGQAVVVQGAALFAFDLLAYRYLQRGPTSRACQRYACGPRPGYRRISG